MVARRRSLSMVACPQYSAKMLIVSSSIILVMRVLVLLARVMSQFPGIKKEEQQALVDYFEKQNKAKACKRAVLCKLEDSSEDTFSKLGLFFQEWIVSRIRSIPTI